MKQRVRTLVRTILLLLATAPYAFAADETVSPPWKRGVRRAPRAAVDTRPPAELPQPLRRAPAADERIARDLDPLERRVVAAANDAAVDAVERLGRRAYFRVGFRHGLLDALNDVRLGRREFREGATDGTLDRDARRAGRDLGSAAAVRIALDDAETAVEAQFGSLANEPRFDPAPAVPRWAAPAVAFESPDLDDLMLEFPIGAFGNRDADLVDWGWNGKRLRVSQTYADVYDRGWDDAQRAFERFADNPANARLLRRLAPVERNALRALYVVTFDRRVDRLAGTLLAAAWDRGLDRGWDYGRFIREEFEYRRGFAEGFRLQAGLTAENVFRAAYPREFESAYRIAFDRWATSAVPAIGRVELIDANDDGVFEPGERLAVDIELINLGGAAGRFDAGLTGAVLTLADSAPVRLARRSAVNRRALLTAAIDPGVAPRTRTDLTVSLGSAARSVDLRVARPLEFDRASLRVLRDNVAGRVEVEIDVHNISRRPLGGDAVLQGPDGRNTASRGALPVLRAGDRATATFVLDGLSPLDLIAGRVNLDLFLDAEGVEQDRASTALAETATDLASRDLSRLLRRFSANGATPVEIAQARELLMRRLRADWSAAVRASGNPYKSDYRSGNDLTALGELVSLSRTAGRSDVLSGMGSAVLRLSDDLPGPHPLLRKYVRRLAKRLP